ncbi:MAG: ABC transporter substrate-binding protein [Spirochaetales bacterium]|jgi:peptide/nickel transport system substrate-binding protein|nr:ABC transporter substrate-binding protein [Spirochaetales bacterium]
MKNKTPVLFFSAALVFVFCACSRGGGENPETGAFGEKTGPSVTAAETPLEGGELRFGLTTEPATLDPLNSANTADGRSILFNVFEGLVKPDGEGSLLPAAAESWTLEQEGLVYVFTLREGLRFHNGDAVTQEDVKFTLETAARAGFAGFTLIEKVEAAGSRDIRVTLRERDPEFLPYITVGIVPKNNADREKNPIGTGPFLIKSYTAQQSLVLAKNPHYWRKDLPHLDTVSFVFVADSDALLLDLRGGSIDAASLTGALVHQLDPAKFDAVPGFSASVQVLALNNAVKPLDDIRVRKAINYAIDVQRIIDTAFFGEGRPSGSPLIPGLTRYYESSLADPYPFDPEKARSLLAEAGYGNGAKKISLEITVPSNYTMHVDTAQVIVSQLAEAGIEAAIKLVDWATWLADIYHGRKYQGTIISVDANNVSPRSFLARYLSDGGSNFMNFKSGEYDRVYAAALAEPSEAKRIELYKEAQKIISRNAAGVYIQDIAGFKVFPKGRFRGLVNYPLYVIDLASIYRIH